MRRIATALVAGLVLIFAQLAPAAAQGGKYHEAPALAEQVKAGKLPPVEQRLPEQPLVVPVVEKTGEYGGVWRRAFLGPADANNYSIRMDGYHWVPISRWKIFLHLKHFMQLL